MIQSVTCCLSPATRHPLRAPRHQPAVTWHPLPATRATRGKVLPYYAWVTYAVTGYIVDVGQACVSQKTQKLLGPENGPVKSPKNLSSVSQSALKAPEKFRAREIRYFFQ